MIQPPKANKISSTINIHGNTINDEYAWLRDDSWPNNIKNYEIIQHLEAENQYFNHFMSPLSDLKLSIFNQLKGMIKLDDISTYVKKDNYYYYSRSEADKSYSIHCRKKDSLEAEEELILDENLLAQNQSFMHIGGISISPDHRYLAYAVDLSGDERYTIKIYDLVNNKYLPDQIDNNAASIIWHQEIFGFFYMPINENLRHNKVMFHYIGNDISQDRLIFHEPSTLYHVNISKSSSLSYIFINIVGYEDNEIYFVEMDDNHFKTKLFRPRQDGVFYTIEHHKEYFYIKTNINALGQKVKNFCICRVLVKNFGDNMWSSYITEDKEKYLQSMQATKDYLLINYNEFGVPLIKVINLTNNKEQQINFPESVFSAEIFSTNFKENDIRINYSSLVRPSTVYSYTFEEDKLSVLKVQEIPSGFNPEEYVVKRVWTSGDKCVDKTKEHASIPVTLLYKKSLFKKDGSNPLYLYGYGSYGISHPVSFRNSAILMADRGLVFAIAHIRGGGELGRDWYESAKFLNKKRTFNDFIKCAEFLIEENYTHSGNIIISGGSAGGLLIGAVLNTKPELFKAAIAHVPFVDVLNTMLDESLPLTPGEFTEWGNPKDPEYFAYMQSYSPYENIKNQNYPTMLVTCGLYDPRVGYWEAVKWVARLRDQKTDDNIIILKTSMDAGHTGASGRFDYLKEVAEDLAFIFIQNQLSNI